MLRSTFIRSVLVCTALLLVSPARAQTAGLVAAYGFSEASGTTTADASGNGNTGTLTSGAARTTAGKFGNAVTVNGAGAFVNLGNGATLQLTGSMTVSAWIRPAAFPVDDAAVASKRSAGELGFQLDTTVDTGPRTIGFKLSSSTGALMARYGGTVLQANQWYHISGVYDAAARTLNVYLNGALDNGTLLGSVTSTQQNSTLNVNVGRRPGLAGFAFNGTIDEVRIYNRALSAADIQVDMQLGVTGGTASDTTAPSAPGTLTATASGSSQINLAWGAATDNVGVTGYRVERCAGSGCTTFAQIATPTGTSFNDTSLTAATSYSYRVRANDAAANLGAYSNVASATTAQAADLTPPTAPASLTATAASSTQINLAWTAATDNVGVTGYRVERCADSGCTAFAQIAAPTGTSFSDTALTGGTSYSYRVRAADAAGNLGGYSPVASATTPAPDLVPPTAPTNLTATGAGSTQINLTWTASTDNVGVTGYRVERCAGSGCSAFAQIATPTGASFSDTGLTGNTSYTYQVRAADAAGNLSAYSNFASATTSAASGAVAAYGFNEAAGTTTADASGNGNTGTLNGAMRTTAGQFGGAMVVNGTGAYVDLGNGPTLQLTGSMTISAWIRPAAFPVDDAAVVSKRAGGELGFQLDTTVDTGPRTIGFKLTSASGANMFRYGSSTLQANQWYHISGIYDATARTLDVYLNGVLDNGTLVGAVTSTQQTSPLNVNVGRRPGLAGFAFNGTIDEVRIYNRALSGTEIQADMGTAVGGGTPLDTIAPSAPGTLTATAAGSTQINLSWGAATDNVGVTGYRLERCAGSGCTTFAQIATPTGTSFSDTGLNAATSYGYRVRAADAAGNLGFYSNVSSATTSQSIDVLPPTVPANLTGTAVSSTQINLSWTASTDDVGVTGYVLQRCQGAGCSTWVTIATPTGTSFNDTGLTPSTTYRYWVRATDAAGNLSAWSSIVTLTTPAASSGLVGAYGFEEASGTATADASGNGNTGTLNGATRTTAGRFGAAVVVNGNGAFVDLGSGPTLELTGSMTISAWIRAAAFPVDDAAVVSKRTGGELGFQLDTTVDTGPRTIGFKLTSASGANMFRYGSTALQANQWYHISGVYDGAAGTLDVYLNGVLDNGVLLGTVTSTQQNSPLNVNIGRRPGFSGFAFNGIIDEVRIYNRALSAAEIQADLGTAVGGASPPDTLAPAVSVTSPTGGATVTSVVSVAANATDNVGVASVQFLLDGAPLGSAVTATPYSVAWDTSTVVTGSHILEARATDFAGNSSTSTPVTVTVTAPSASTSGQWAAPLTWPIVGVHAHLLPTGEVLAWDGQQNGNQARLWNPGTGVFTSVSNPNSLTNMFCSGHCLLPDGKVVVTGGHVTGHVGLRDTNLFNPATRAWSMGAPMAVGRWYPTTIPLPDGRVLVTSGEINCAGCFAPIPEIYDPQADSWTQLTGASQSFPYYPHMFVLPDGRVLAAASTEDAIVSQVLDIPTQTWSVVDPNAVDGGGSAMYAPGKILKSGRSVDPDQPVIPSTATTYVLDMNQSTPRWRATPPMAFARTFHTLTLLPDGTVLATGGGPTTDAVGVNSAVLAAELWSPVTESWATLASMSRARLYHSTALLLPDARVLVLGGGRVNGINEPTDQLSSQLFSPPYLFKGARPTITSAPSTAAYGAAISVQTPDAASIGSVSLIRLGSVTHSFNTNQRIVELPFTAGAGDLSVQITADANLAPPGHYMLFILNTSGVPSVASIVQLH